MRNTLPAFNSSPENPDTGFLCFALPSKDAEQYCNDSLSVSKWKHFLRVICIAGIFMMSGAVSWSQSAPRYNILFVSIDDLNSRLNFMGMPEVPTPNLQRLVNRGMVFNNSYCQYPLCSPSRTSLLTGWRPDRIGIFTNLVRPRTVLGSNVVFLPEHFKNNGYRIERYGKIMHGLYENDINWDYAEPPEGSVAKASGSESVAASDVPWWVKTIPDAQTNDGAVARDLAARLRQTINSPFFYALGLSTHDPFTPNLPYWNKVGDPETQDLLPINNNGLITNVRGNGSANIILPQTPPGDRNDIPSIALTKQIVLSEYEWKQAIHAYDGEIAQMDAQLGLVLDELDRQNLWNNTIVVFWSDHGLNLGEHDGAWFKNLLFNETAKVPMIVCVPGKPAGVCSRPVELVDLYPTLAELCGLPVPADLEGSSFARLLDNPTLPWKRAVFTQVTRANIMGRSVKTDQYHYNSWGNNGEELYDNLADPYEYTNLVANPAYASVLTQMRTILAEGWTKSLPPACTQYAYYPDNDQDGFGGLSTPVFACEQPTGYVADSSDCDDMNAAIHPGATEICNGIDDNCNGETDEGVQQVFYLDEDNDGYGAYSFPVAACVQPVGYVTNNSDCNDSNPTIYPGAPEICGNGIDDNCDGQVDELLPVTYYADTDNDGFGDPNNAILSCDQPQGYITDNTDCDDTNAAVYPGAPEICNGIDDNCDGQVDELLKETYYADTDNDGFGDPNNTILSCDQPQGYVTDNTDCNDTNPAIYPGALEICNGVDDNCDGQVDEGVQSVFYRDADADGYGNVSVTILACSAPSGYVAVSGDCNDNNAAVRPGAPEVCANGIDDNCNGQVDETTPTAVITPLGNTNICTTGSVILEATAGSGYRYQWRRNNVVITGANKRRYTATTPGNYRVGILNFFTGCSKLSAAVTVTGCSPAAVTSVTGGESIIITQDKPLLYPNPSTGTVQISFSSAMKGTVLLKVSDLSGRTLLSRQANAVQGANNLQLDLRQLANGIYFFELTNNGIPRRIQFVISR